MTARRAAPSRLGRFLLDVLRGLWQALVGLLAATGLAVIAIATLWALEAPVPGSAPGAKAQLQQLVQPLGQIFLPEDEAPRRRPVIYLNREGAQILAGLDDSSTNRSSVVAHAGLEAHDVAAFRGTPARWDAIVQCVRSQFEDFDVDVVDRRPAEGPYVMVMVGGQPGDLASSDGLYHGVPGRLSGLAPMASEPVEQAVAYVFARDLGEQTRPVCETIAHEVGHVFGLDHVMDCHDPMSYLPRCGNRSFQEQESACGERADRLCADGKPTQSSHARLLEVLGPRAETAG